MNTLYFGDNLEILRRHIADASVDLVYLDPPFNSNRNYEVFWGETKEKRAFEDRHASTQAYIDYMRPRCVELARVLKKAGSFCAGSKPRIRPSPRPPSCLRRPPASSCQSRRTSHRT